MNSMGPSTTKPKSKDVETFWDGYLVGIITVIVLLVMITAICHFLGYPIIVFE